ncbi:hypothetical protein ACHAW5_002118 [Stephanodiscus triporus]|uniref:BRCA1-associated protein n=1 Tax=Stephanodiscus triporus TaxID=2934178 RepID=A0ABD3MZJ2_9STRA
MVNVPPHQVPDGVLNLVRGHRPFIEHVRIVIGSSRLEEAEYRRQRGVNRAMDERHRMKADEKHGMRRSRSQTWACEEEKEGVDDDHHLNSSFDAISISKHADCNSNSRGTRGSRSTSLDFSHVNVRDVSAEEEKYSAEDRDNNNVGEDKNYHILFVMDSEDSAETFVTDLHRRPYTSLDESETCSVYHTFLVKGEDGVSLLGPFFASSTSSPNDTEHQCPVCLEMLCIPSQSSISAASSLDAPSSILTTVCNHSFHIDCLARWQDSPCPVCRYDHSGLNETLSRCQVCAATLRNYVCLICGAISCANGHTSPSTNEGVDQTPQAPSHLGHALQHYQETLHAYALDTETQHVWDFAGGGYVHRLLQNLEDGKIVEGTDPRLMEEERGLNLLINGGGGGATLPLTALERSTVPTYSSSSEDDEAIHRKLEGFAGQYYTLLKSQLEQQRIFYEGQLEAIRREHENSTRNGRQSTSDLISALKQERNQLEQRCMTLRRKHKKVSDSNAFLENMNECLEADKLSFRRQIADAQADLAEATQLTQQLLTPMEEKLSLLMLQLENGISEDTISDWKSPSK